MPYCHAVLGTKSAFCLWSSPGGLDIDSPSWLNIMFVFFFWFVSPLNNKGEFSVSLSAASPVWSASVFVRASTRPCDSRMWLYVLFYIPPVLSLHIRARLCFIHCEARMCFFTTESFLYLQSRGFIQTDSWINRTLFNTLQPHKGLCTYTSAPVLFL